MAKARTVLAAVLPGAAIALMAAFACTAHADEAAILGNLKLYFSTEDAETRLKIAQSIAADEAFDRSRLSGWLHSVALFEPLDAGSSELAVALRNGQSRNVTLRIPAGYDCRKPWPVIYALHGTGGNAAGIIRYIEELLGPRVDEFVIAAPQDYGDVVVHEAWPPVSEHPTALAAVRRKIHVDSDRVYVMGYSRGGHATWTLLVLCTDQFAGGAALAGSFLLPGIQELWEGFLPNLKNTRLLCVWGEDDTLDDNGAPSPQGGIAKLNRDLSALGKEMKIPIAFVELPETGHTGVRPPANLLDGLLMTRRVHFPPELRHRFRDIQQAQAYWLQGLSWTGPQWTDEPLRVSMRTGETADEALAREYRRRLGELHGKITGQQVRVDRNKIDDLAVWVGEDMIDWKAPVVLNLGGRKIFEQTLTPDLAVCLTRARQTYDFERLVWAGLRIRNSRAELLDGISADVSPDAK